MRPNIRTQFFEDIKSFNQFALDLLAGKVILCETLQDCSAAVKHIQAGLYDNNKFEEITLFIMPELQLQLLKHKAAGDQAVEAITDIISLNPQQSYSNSNINAK
jgi:hypothetical protein